MAKLHATTPAAHLGRGQRVIWPKINLNGQALRHNFEKKRQGEPEEDAKSHKRVCVCVCIEIGLLEAEARGVAYVLIMFTAGVNELVLVVFIETVGKAPRQGLISRRRPGLHGSNHSTSVMAFGAKGSENQGRQSWVQRCGEPPGPPRPAAPGREDTGTAGGAARRPAEPPEGRGALPPPGSRGEDEEPSAIFPCPPKHQRCRATRRGLRGRRCRHPPLVIPTHPPHHHHHPRPAGPGSPPPSRRTPPSRTPTRGAPSPGERLPPLRSARRRPAAAQTAAPEQPASPRRVPGPGLGFPAPPGHSAPPLTPARLLLVPRLLLRRPGAFLGAAEGARPRTASSQVASRAESHARPRDPGRAAG